MGTPDTTLRARLARLRDRLPHIPDGTVEAVCAGLVALLPITNAQRYAGDRLGFTLELLLCVCVAIVGRWPVQASLAGMAVMTAILALPLDTQRPSLIVMLVAITSLGARGLNWLRATVTVWWLAVVLLLENSPPQPVGAAIGSGVFYLLIALAAWGTGEAIHRIASERARGRVDRTAAVQAQRRTIARDLHDTIAYSTTSIILRAEQAKLRGVSDPQVAADLDFIIAAGRNSMRDLRGMMETLRRNDPDNDDDRSPWQISSLDEVLRQRAEELRAHGFVVTSHVDADLAALPESVRETLGKVVAEATGNMVKHGDPSGPVRILVESGTDDVEAVFINKPRPRGTGRPETGQLGLIGARERVEALGGEVQVTSETPEWVVRVRIPLGG